MFEWLLSRPRDRAPCVRPIAYFEYEAHDWCAGCVRGRVPASTMDEARKFIRARGFRLFVAWPEGLRPATGWARVWLPGKSRGETVVGDFELTDGDDKHMAARYRIRGVLAMGLLLFLAGAGMTVLWALERTTFGTSFGLLLAGAVLMCLGIAGCTLRMRWCVKLDRRQYAISASMLGFSMTREVDLSDAKRIRVSLDYFFSADGDYRAYNVSAIMSDGEYVPLFVGGPNLVVIARRLAEALALGFVEEA